MANPNMNAGFAGKMLDVSEAIIKVKGDIAALNTYSKHASDNEFLLRKLTTNIDSKTTILSAEISIMFQGVGAVSLQLSNTADKLVIEKLISTVAETLAARTAAALEEINKIAARMSA